MTRPAHPTSDFSGSKLGLIRTRSGVIAAESTTLTDANFPPTEGMDCQGFETVFVGVEIDAGASPTVTLEVLVRDPDAADGSRWKKLLLGSPPGVTVGAVASQKTSALDGTSLYEVRVFGRLCTFRVDAVTNAAGTTAARILAMPGKRALGGLSRFLPRPDHTG